MNNLSPSISKNSNYMENIQTLSGQFPLVLDEFKKAYIELNMNPSDATTQSIYSKIKSTLDNLNDDVTKNAEELRKNNAQLIKSINDINVQLSKEKILNSDMNFHVRQTEGSELGSSMLIDNYKELHKMQRISNVNMFLGVSILGVLLFSLFKKNQVIM